MDTSKVTRFEVIDHRPCKTCDSTGIMITPTFGPCSTCGGGGFTGRTVVEYGVSVGLSLQDGNRTLKVFLTDGEVSDGKTGTD